MHAVNSIMSLFPYRSTMCRTAAFFVLLFILTACGGKGGGLFSPPRVPTTFKYQKPADSVFICADFNNWNCEEHPMDNDNGEFTLRIKLKPGKYAYLYLIDEIQMVLDPEAYLSEDDGFGGKNSVIIVE